MSHTKGVGTGWDLWGSENNAGCLHRWPLWHKERPRNQNRLHNIAPQGDYTLKVTLSLTQKNAYWGVIQGRGHGVTQPRTLLLHPASFQMHWNVWSAHSDVFNYNHMHHNRRLPLSKQRRNLHHMSVQCANRSYLRFTALHQLNEVSKKDVSVPLAETFYIVGHLEERCGISKQL